MLSLDVKPTMCHQRKYGAAFQLDGTPAFRKTSTASSSSEKRDNAGTQKMPARGMTTVARMRPPAIAVSISIDTRSWSECTRTAPSTLRCGRSACHGDAQLGDTGSPGKCSSNEPHCKAQKPHNTMAVVRITGRQDGLQRRRAPWRRHGGARHGGHGAPWQQQPAPRAVVEGGRNAGARHHARQGHHVQPLTWSLLSSPVMVCTAGLCCSVGRSVDERARRRSVGLGGVGPQRLTPTLF